MSTVEKTREEIAQEITQQEVHDKAFITGTLVATAEIFISGRLPDREGYKRLDKALKLMDEYEMTNEELGIYINAATPNVSDKVKRYISLVFKKGVKA